MADIIQNLINSVLEDGARPTKYKCEINLPSDFEQSGKELDVICKTVTLPSVTMEPIFVKYKGKNIPVPGQQRYSHTIDLTFYLDDKHTYKILFEEWLQSLNYDKYHNNVSGEAETVAFMQNDLLQNAKTNIRLTQLTFEHEPAGPSYVFYNVFPKEVSQIIYSADAVSSILEFNVAFVFSHYEIELEEEGVNANDVANSILGGIQGVANDIVDSAMGYLTNSEAGKAIDSGAKQATTAIQDAGKTVSTSIDEFLG